MNLFGRKPKDNNVIEGTATVVETRKTREQRLQAAVKAYSHAVLRVLRENRISARVQDAYISPRFIGIGVRLFNVTQLPDAKQTGDQAALAAGCSEVIVIQVGKFLYYQFTLPSNAWLKVNQVDDFIGMGPRNSVERFRLSDAPHTLIAGMTGSGKTVLTHSIMLSLSYNNTPDDLGVLIFDPHLEHEDFDSWEFLRYQIARSDDEMLRLAAVIEWELNARIDGNEREKRKWVIIVDEAEMVCANEEILHRLARVAKEGRKFGMHLIVVTQKPDHKNLRGVLPELDNRYLGKMASASVSGVYGAGLNLHKLTSQGDFVHTAKGRFHRFTAAVVPPQAFEQMKVSVVEPIPEQAEFLNPAEVAQPKPSHRPRIEATPEAVAYYLKQGPDNVTIAQAEEALGLKRTGHNINKQFAQKLVELMEEE